jgi:hypothetical protein
MAYGKIRTNKGKMKEDYVGGKKGPIAHKLPVPLKPVKPGLKPVKPGLGINPPKKRGMGY